MATTVRTGLGTRATVRLAGHPVDLFRIADLPGAEALPLSRRIILENLLRHDDGRATTVDQVEAALSVDGIGAEVAFRPSRVFLHDTNGVPVLTDLAALRDAVAERGGDPARVRPHVPAELVVDHSVSTDFFGRPDAAESNRELEYSRHAERYRFLKWGAGMPGLTVVPPGSGIMHQLNVERLARVVEVRDGIALPDTCLGTDSHTTMVSGLGVLAWGVGGVEAESALLGLPLALAIPAVVQVELVGELGSGVTATDLVLTLTQRLRAHGVVGKIVEFVGPSLAHVSVETRTTIANMAPEYGATTGLFPVDDAVLRYLRLTGRADEHVALVEGYAKEQLLWDDGSARPGCDERLVQDLAEVEPSLAGPRRPQDRLGLADVRPSLRSALEAGRAGGREPHVDDGKVALASITSCTNTSNPHVMVAAALLARNAARRGLGVPAWVKTSLAPGSRVVTAYLEEAGLDADLDRLGFQTVGYGCMTCIGNSGDLTPELRTAVDAGARVASVLSGNRNFDGRIHNDVSLNYLASPPLVVAFALAGTVDVDLARVPLGTDPDGRPVHLADLWPSEHEVEAVIAATVRPEVFAATYEHALDGDERWRALEGDTGVRFAWDETSTYVRRPPFLELPSPGARDLVGARVLAQYADSVTTDHISPAGRIPRGSPAAAYLRGLGVADRDLNTYASRRGNFEVMRRGGFSNPRLANLLLPDGPGGWTTNASGEPASVVDAADSYADLDVPLVVVAGHEYGTGSSRDWAAKVTALLGVRAVLARSFERIHRSNLVHLGVLPVELSTDADLGLLRTATAIDVLGVEAALHDGTPLRLRVDRPGGAVELRALARVDTSLEAEFMAVGGALPYALRRLLDEGQADQ